MRAIRSEEFAYRRLVLAVAEQAAYDYQKCYRAGALAADGKIAKPTIDPRKAKNKDYKLLDYTGKSSMDFGISELKQLSSFIRSDRDISTLTEVVGMKTNAASFRRLARNRATRSNFTCRLGPYKRFEIFEKTFRI